MQAFPGGAAALSLLRLVSLSHQLTCCRLQALKEGEQAASGVGGARMAADGSAIDCMGATVNAAALLLPPSSCRARAPRCRLSFFNAGCPSYILARVARCS